MVAAAPLMMEVLVLMFLLVMVSVVGVSVEVMIGLVRAPVIRAVGAGVSIGGDAHHGGAVGHARGREMDDHGGGDADGDAEREAARVGFCGESHEAENRHTGE